MTDQAPRGPRLTDLQLVLLSAAAARSDLMLLPPPDGVRARGKILERSLAKLLERDLVEEVPARQDAETWRETPEGDRIGLRLSEAGRAALGLDADAAPAASPAPGGALSPPRPGTKQACLAEMLATPGGATLGALADALGWQPHTTRAAITGLRKRGFEITVANEGDVSRVYRIVAEAERADAA